MKPGPFAYHDPRSLDDLLGLLGRLEDVKILAGGQSLMPMMNMRFVQPSHVVDINRIDDLAYIREEADHVAVGAGTRQKTLLASQVLARHVPLVLEALTHVGHFQTRNRGTIGGSLCHLDPAAELPLAALLHDATLTIRGPSGTRRVPAREWAMAYMTPNLAPDEVLVEIALPKDPSWTGRSFLEFARRHGDFAIVSVGCLLDRDSAGTIRRAALALGGAMQTPVRLDAVEAMLVGQRAGPDLFAAARAEASRIEALADAYYSADYRRRLAGVLVERALAQAAAGMSGEHHHG